MRTLAAIVILLLISATAAQADSGFSFRVEVGGGDAYYHHYGYDDGWYLGDRGYWGGAYRVPPEEWYYGDSQAYNQGYQRNNRGYQSIIKPYRSIIKPYQPLVPSHPADRPGFKLYPPRSIYGPPELYGDYVTDANGYPIATRTTPYSLGGRRHHRGYYGRSPLVYQYSYGYSPYYYGSPYYTAPAYPNYGYYPGGVVYRQLPVYGSYGSYDSGYPGSEQVEADEINVYQGDVYHINYAGPQAAPSPTTRPPEPPAGDERRERTAPPQPEDQQPREQAIGGRFYDRLRLKTEHGTYEFTIDNTNLNFVGPDGSYGKISDGLDPDFGAYAAYLPGDGPQAIYREGDKLYGAYPQEDGSWWPAALPYDVDFNESITVGLVGGAPWVVFNDLGGTRYVVGFAGQTWFEIGSGAAGNAG
jgi:hypothetical protein